jgi:hypothetical protein
VEKLAMFLECDDTQQRIEELMKQVVPPDAQKKFKGNVHSDFGRVDQYCGAHSVPLYSEHSRIEAGASFKCCGSDERRSGTYISRAAEEGGIVYQQSILIAPCISQPPDLVQN